MFTRCRRILKTVKDVTAAKFELVFTRYRNNLKMLQNLTVKYSLQDVGAEEMYLQAKNPSVWFQKCRKRFRFYHFRVFTQCRFKNVPIRVPFSKSTVFNNLPAKNVPVSCEWGCLSVTFSPFSKCASIM